MVAAFTGIDIFEWVFQASIAGSVTVLLVAALTWALQRAVHVKWLYFMWLLVPLRLLLPWTPESALSTFQFLPGQAAASPHVIADAMLPGLEVDTGAFVGGQMIITSTAPSGVGEYVSTLVSVAFWVWAAGAAITGAVLLYRSVAFGRLVRRANRLSDADALEALENCKRQLQITADIPLVQADFIASPALYGLWRPKLLLPIGGGEGYSVQEYRHIFMHELIHFKRKDIAVNWLMSLLLVLHWFNPLLWMAAYRLRAAQEISCDSAALAALGSAEVEAEAYGRTLIRLLESRQHARRGLRIAYLSEANGYFRRRIAMIAHYRRATLRSAVIGAACLLLLGCTALTGPIEDREIVAEFRDYKITKQQLAQIFAEASDEQKIKGDLTLHMMVMDAKALGIEPDLAEIDRTIEKEKQTIDPEMRKNHLFWMDKYGLKGDAYWQKMRDDLILSDILNQYAARLFPDPKEIGGNEYKKRYNAFMDETYEKYKSEVRVYYDRLNK